jgi:hypothetical protein
MHTTEWSGESRPDGHDEVRVEVYMHHNGDYSGDVEIVVVQVHLRGTNDPRAVRKLVVPFAALAELVGGACMLDVITQLEDLTGAQFLGLEPLDKEKTDDQR